MPPNPPHPQTECGPGFIRAPVEQGNLMRVQDPDFAGRLSEGDAVTRPLKPIAGRRGDGLPGGDYTRVSDGRIWAAKTGANRKYLSMRGRISIALKPSE